MKCIVELFGDDRNGRKMIAWGRRIGCGDGIGLRGGAYKIGVCACPRERNLVYYTRFSRKSKGA